jgi:acetylornithine/succinyldiaminopimelate/putrescine aminotransferase
MSAEYNILTDHEGKEWLDLQSGILNTPFGHGSQTISRAINSVVRAGLINTYDRASSAQGELIALMGTYQPGYTWKPFNTGGEAIDKAIQIAATRFGYMPRIAVLHNSFHGKLLSMAWANKPSALLPWGNPLNIGIIDPNTTDADFDVLIYEPVQGHDGHVNDETVLRNLCDEREALLIADEMITGFMRCGERFMSKTADIIVCGKGISGGVPLSMVGFKPSLLADHSDTIATGWRSTGAGNNLAMAVGIASLARFIHSEESIKIVVNRIQTELMLLGFTALGALGFKSLKNHAATKSYFESERVIASFHCPGQVRVGPSLITLESEFEILRATLEAVDEL